MEAVKNRGANEDVHQYDRNRFIANPFPKDPPALSPLALLNPRETQTLKDRMSHAWEQILRQTDPQKEKDYTIYTGSAGIGYLALHSALLVESADPRRRHFVDIARNYLRGAQATLEGRLRQGRHEDISFILGTPGVYAPLAVLRRLQGKSNDAVEACIQRVLDLAPLFLNQTHHHPRRQHPHYEFEILYGESGYLTSLLYLNSNFPGRIPDQLLSEVTDHIISGAEEGPGGALLWAWHGKEYLGAAHGVSGILLALLDVHLQGLRLPDVVLERIQCTVNYLYSLRLPSGNYPTRPSKECDDRLVQWCHGAPGILLLFVKAYEVFGQPKYLAWAELAADVVWMRGLLRKGNGLCHGVAGNAYCFLAVFRCTDNDIYLHRARVFALAAQDDIVAAHQDTPDHSMSLFEGLGGLLALYADLLEGDPRQARFPAFETRGVRSGTGTSHKEESYGDGKA
jgi:lantibiotic modifying enzyme